MNLRIPGGADFRDEQSGRAKLHNLSANLANPGDSIHLPVGFSFATANAGIKKSGRSDLAFVEAAPGTRAAALFTKNLVIAAPVQVGRSALTVSRGHVRAVIVNSGNANCATGKRGLRDCRRISARVAALLGAPVEEIFPSSTGIIGVPLPAAKILAALPDLVSRRTPSEENLREFAQTILTTDTRAKIASTNFRSGSEEVKLAGVAKGAGMIHPQMATMLVYLFTDAMASPAELKRLLKQACRESFNCISIDGDTSTNDTILLLASGQSGVTLQHPRARKLFSNALFEVCKSLAHQIVADGEGVTHVIRLHIEAAKGRNEALAVARAISHSPLVKTAWAGADPNWGRMLAAVGASGLPIDPNRVDIFIGNQKVCSNGASNPFDEAKAHAELAKPECDIRIRLRRGNAAVTFLTSDLTAEYVRINADYST